MVSFFKISEIEYIAIGLTDKLSFEDNNKLCWLFGNAIVLEDTSLHGRFIGPRKETPSPWSTNAVEVTQIMGIRGISRIEKFIKVSSDTPYDYLLQEAYNILDQHIFDISKLPAEAEMVDDIAAYNQAHDLAMSEDEIEFLENISKQINRSLTDSEVYGFAQLNSEHCRHKIFNGSFIIDEQVMPETLFGMIRKTSAVNPNRLVSAYSDNVAFIKGPKAIQFAPIQQDRPDFYRLKDIQTVISIKAETHNFPTTVEPFNGASTGTGGEIRDRMAGGKGSVPLAGTAVYMTAYPRVEEDKSWEQQISPRPWLYQSPLDILMKASNGASDYGNKFGQPLINGSLLTFEHQEGDDIYGYDKVIMMAGGVGYAKAEDATKLKPEEGDKIVILGGDNYRIGMGGGAVSSVDTENFDRSVALNAVQRSNPEIQKRVANVVRAMVEAEHNPIRSIHDHGAGGHFNSISELVEESGGIVHLDRLPIGDTSLSDKEILGNESQERMGLLINPKDAPLLERIAKRERAPYYEVGTATNDKVLKFQRDAKLEAVDLKLEHLLGKPPKTVLTDQLSKSSFSPVSLDEELLEQYLHHVLRMEAVGSKDWLVNKVDRSVSGLIATQQTVGAIQLPLNNLGVVSIDFSGTKGIASAIGHAPVAALINPETGSRLAVAEALTNIVWAEIEEGLKGVSLSANWMWPAKNPGENARLYQAVKALSDFCIELGINVPTGKDSLSMTQKYPDGTKVQAPGTVVASAAAEVADIRKTVSPVLKPNPASKLLYIDFSGDEFHLGGSILAQSLNQVGDKSPDILETQAFIRTFNVLQQLISNKLLLAGHDVSAGGLITTLLEMNFANCDYGLQIDLNSFKAESLIHILFSEKPAVVVQIEDEQKVCKILDRNQIRYQIIGQPIGERALKLNYKTHSHTFDIDALRDSWFSPSYMFERHQSESKHALQRFKNYKRQDLEFSFGHDFRGRMAQFDIQAERNIESGIRAAVIREKGTNGERELAYALYLAGFDVKDVHMTDLIEGREDLSDIHMIVFAGGSTNSDVFGPAKGWVASFLHNEKAKQALDRFFEREDTLSLGVCNGCQLMVGLNLIYPEHPESIQILPNDSGKFESAFLTVEIPSNNSIMLKSMESKRLGVWVSHGQGKFNFPCYKDNYNIPMTYGFSDYPANPNGSDWDAAAICSNNGRHLAMMPHIERAVLPWQWAYYPENRASDEISPWIEAFVNARKWIAENKKL